MLVRCAAFTRPHIALEPNGEAMKHEREAFDYLVQVKTPKSFAAALDRAALSRLMSRSGFIRTTLADRLTSDGIEISGAA
jgi:hypothetical protein